MRFAIARCGLFFLGEMQKRTFEDPIGVKDPFARAIPAAGEILWRRKLSIALNPSEFLHQSSRSSINPNRDSDPLIPSEGS
jgi:predicted Rdx family selenoprotein